MQGLGATFLHPMKTNMCQPGVPRAQIAPFGLEMGAECFDVMLGLSKL